MASYISNVESNLDSSGDSSRKKRRKIGGGDEIPNSSLSQTTHPQSSMIRWKSESEQRIYSTKLVEALSRTRRSSSSSPGKVGKVRETADRVLAVAAKGTTRWSRAILASRHMLMRNRLQRKHRKVKVTDKSRLQKPPEIRTTRLPPLQKKVRTLSRLVPGCRKLPFPNLLEETTDYIAALEMQVRAMTALAELLTGSPVNRPGSTINASS
ncbi:transcription factor bHLH149-like [Humulus lupulus]|uniref:transcription factor bHLH149-like n=1 Tax=Humulus lupulus TaxID=3486 RepID=UPI002B41831C|nr:transcription factor bHLH149-like [Humulus lupulus]